MASKRKRTDAPLASPPPEGLRRSSRKTKENAGSGNATPELPDYGRTESKGRKGPATLWDSKEGVEIARKQLSQMEMQLKGVNRRQRLAIESSDLGAETQTATEHPPRRRSLQADKEVVNERPKDEPDEFESAPLDRYDAALANGDVAEAKLDEIQADRGAKRPPPVNSATLPLPWTGRLGYACLNTYLRTSTPPVFSSRTCRMASIVEHRHPLRDPSQPEHAVKNRPDKEQPADVERGLKFVQDLGLANARDIVKMLRWNDKYGIKFMRLSSEMFPFASHQDHGYKLAPFASEALAEAGRVAGELGHRLTTHPGQFTQIGSPRKEVVTAAVRDLEYHNELLSLLKLPEQADRDAVMILHMGGVYGDKAATLDRFRENYAKLSDGVKRRLVLENDDVAWSVHDLLPICEELNIPMVLDFHHHNIIFDSCVREGSHDILDHFERIRKTWTRKNITQKMHYSEQTAGAVTPRERRKHSARVKTLPPCGADMDLMIEAKDKEQAVFELMRTYRLPGWDAFKDMVPYEREDEPRKAVMKKNGARKPKKARTGASGGEVKKEEAAEKAGGIDEADEEEEVETPERRVSEEVFGMGGPEDRVYWPEGMEEWLKPKKRDVNKQRAVSKKGTGKKGGTARMASEAEDENDDC